MFIGEMNDVKPYPCPMRTSLPGIPFLGGGDGGAVGVVGQLVEGAMAANFHLLAIHRAGNARADLGLHIGRCRVPILHVLHVGCLRNCLCQGMFAGLLDGVG